MVQNLDDGSTTGAIIIGVAAIFAIFFLSLTFMHMGFVLFAPSYARRIASTQERNFLTSPMGFYIICLLAANYITAIGGVLELQWTGPRMIAEGPACTTQAILLQLGNNATALWMGILSIAALRTFVFRARVWPKYVILPLIGFLWTFMVAFDVAASAIFKNSSSNFFYGPAGMWCWITPEYRLARMVTQYAWMWLWSFVGIVCFLLVLLAIRGNIVVKVEASGSTLKWRSRSFYSYDFGNVEERYGNLVGGVGRTMCWFPVSYILLTLPLSAIRIFDTYGFPVPAYAFTLAAVVFSLIGMVNPGLYFAIRHSLNAATRSDGTSSEATLRNDYGRDKTDIESFETPAERRPSNGNTFAAYPWTPGANSQTYPASSIVYGANNGVNGTSRLSIYGTPISPPMPEALASNQVKDGSTPRASFNTIPRRSVQLSSVTVTPEPSLKRSRPSPTSNTSSPAGTEKFAYVPLTPGLQTGHQRADSDSASMYSGSRSISPNLNALIAAAGKEPATPTGLQPPPRKARLGRSPSPSVPVDVDESDDGSICLAGPTTEVVKQDESLPISPGDVATRNPKRADSMRTFWAAYEDPSPISPNMPLPPDAVLRRDTMRTFWAAYEDRSPNFSDAFTLSRGPTMDSRYVRSIHSGNTESSVFRRKPSAFSTVGNRSTVGSKSARQGDLLSPALMSPSTTTSSQPVPSMMSPPLFSPSGPMGGQQHGRSSSLTSFVSTSNVSRQGSAVAVPSRLGTPQLADNFVQGSRNSDYRVPRPQPGYL